MTKTIWTGSGFLQDPRCPGKIAVQELYKSSLGKISVRGLLTRSQQISMQCLCTRSLSEISGASSLEEFSWQDWCKRPLGRISATDLYAISVYKISKRGVPARSLYKISIRGLLARLLKRSLYKRSPQKSSVGDLQVRFLFKLSIKDLRAKSLLSSPGLWTRSI